MRRPVISRSILALLLLAAAGAVVASRVRIGGPASVVLVTIDTLRADRLGCYGYGPARTPVLDRLAAEGALFEDTLASCPVTLPSHATVLTGLHPPRHGLRDNDSPLPLAAREDRAFRTAAEILREEGYRTAAFVSGSPLAPRWGLDAGFDRYDAPEEGEPGEIGLAEREGGETVDRALGFLGSRERSRPFFLWVHLFDPHVPYAAPGGGGHPPDSPEAYDEEVAHADAQVGRLVDFLRKEGSLDRTVFLVTSDHGEGLGDHGEQTHGYFLHRSTLRVPWIVRHPRRVRAGIRVPSPAGLVDLLPTLLDLAGASPAGTPLDGVSQVPALRGEASSLGPRPEGVPDQYAETLQGWRTFLWAQGVAARHGDRHVIDHGGDRREVRAVPGGEALGPDPGDAAAAEKARTLFGSAPLASRSEGIDPGLGPVGYVSAYGPLRVLPPADNAALPLPSAPFLARFLAAVRLLDRARGDAAGGDPVDLIRTCREVLDELDLEEPGNPALPFWRGRAWALEARLTGGQGIAAARKWKEAFFQYTEAGRRGYRNARTVSLMLQAAHMAGEKEAMLKVAEEAAGGPSPINGDAAYWAWIALAHIEGGVARDGRLLPDRRAAAEAFLAKASARARSAREKDWIAQVRSLYQ